MIIDKIILHNFGIYAGLQEIVLTPHSSEKPVILFGGLNGGGKTTLLDALQLCLYGAQAKTSNRGKASYQEYLRRCINRSATKKEAAISLQFRHVIDGEEVSYDVQRNWAASGASVQEYLTIKRNGETDKALSENWMAEVAGIFPPNIAHLFLFDGEKVERYADKSTSAEVIGTAIEGLLGLDIVDQLSRDLIVLERRKRSEVAGSAFLKEKEKIEEAQADLRKQLVPIKDMLGQLVRDHGYVEGKLDDKILQYKRSGGELFDNRDRISDELAKCKEHLNEHRKALKKLVSGALPFLLIQDVLEGAASRAEAESEAQLSARFVEMLRDRDQHLFSAIADLPAASLRTIQEFLKADIAEREKSASSEALLNISDEARDELQLLLKQTLPQQHVLAGAGMEVFREAEGELAFWKTEYENIPSEAELKVLLDEIEDLKQKEDELANQIADQEILKVSLEHQLADWTRRLDKLVEEEGYKFVEDEKVRRILHHSTKVRGTIKSFREIVVARHIHRIETLVLDSFQQLLRKANLIDKISIAPSTFELSLYRPSGELLPTDRLSAGERQLLSIALLWGLARASGRPLPMAIDTPLGRLDSIHRRLLVERYFPFASHQVILLSTDEEITGDCYDLLKPYIGRTYNLDFDADTGSTNVGEGYELHKGAA
ncbi:MULTISPECIES: DNA sulfur modification protein DndD [Kordiimonas]|jgi:DNA sulfur modification protein DndD|uniref:DNA sulfur modification protein DndD n=1 Tax=Kordiimonas TaxID=288021 RepID=UPI00257C75FC|nr:DNA sulfur modification protein DndD [Kordiimonas sp. UBA4487]